MTAATGGGAKVSDALKVLEGDGDTAGMDANALYL